MTRYRQKIIPKIIPQIIPQGIAGISTVPWSA